MLPKRKTEQPAAESIVALIDYLLPEVTEIDPLAAQFLLMSRRLLGDAHGAAKLACDFCQLWRQCQSGAGDAATVGDIRRGIVGYAQAARE